MIRVGLIGSGYWGSKLYRYLEENKNFDVFVVPHDEDIINLTMKEKSVKAVVIATPNNTHYEFTKMALENGKHVMCEKPLAFKYEECKELRRMRDEQGVTLTTEYTFTFSRLIQKMLSYCNNPKYISMNVKHLGRFGGGNVYWLLGSHMLSILDMIIPIDSIKFRRTDLLVYNKSVESGRIDFISKDIIGEINLSLNYPYKGVDVTIYNEDSTIVYNPNKKYQLEIISYERINWDVNVPNEKIEIEEDESNNLRYAVEYFYNVIKGEESDNLDRAIMITKVLERLEV